LTAIGVGFIRTMAADGACQPLRTSSFPVKIGGSQTRRRVAQLVRSATLDTIEGITSGFDEWYGFYLDRTESYLYTLVLMLLPGRHGAKL